ncbi:MAG TPA: peptidoglycan-binding domain-containing protein [Stellaceae bacterium]|jgi:peptidoglycan hydrolase-like protein with peptidoglycan-binding domain
MNTLKRCVIFLLAVVTLPMQPWPAGRCAAQTINKTEDLEVTPSLVREIQFMLLRLGAEPGPIDGVIGPQTTRAWRKFQQDTGLPQLDLVNGGKIPATMLARLRSDASRVIFQGERKPEAPAPTLTPSALTPPAAAVAPVQPAVQAPDRFAACPFNAEDFRIGKTQYTPEKYLQEGFEGSTVRAVAMLKDRLDEARQIAGNIGGSALTEVQRQSRVLDYFNCRLKIEQASQK